MELKQGRLALFFLKKVINVKKITLKQGLQMQGKNLQA